MRIPPHLNPTSPHEYHLPQLFQTGSSESVILNNTPKFTFGKRPSNYAIISKDHKQDIIGMDSPGVGTYNTCSYGCLGKSTVEGSVVLD